MNYEGKDLVATGAELVAASAHIGEAYGSLSRLPRILPTAEVEAQVKAFLEQLPPERSQVTSAMIAAVANPGRAGTLHYTLGDVEVRRGILAWHPAIGTAWTYMFFAGSRWHLRLLTPEEMLRVLMEVLQESLPLRSTPYRCCLNTSSSLLFLGILHLLHAAHLQACLSHVESPLSFDPTVLPDILHEGGTEDFRWPLYFFDKVLPHSVEVMPWNEEMAAALADLVKHDLIAPSGSDYQLTPNGFAFAAGFRHHLTKIGLRFTSQNAAAVEAHEALLLVRSPHDLHLLDVGGKESALASLTLADARKLLEVQLHVGPAGAESAETAPHATTAAAKRTCTVCGARFSMGEKVCPTCGTPAHADSAPAPAATAPPPLPQVPRESAIPLCKKCGKPLAKATSKFCGSCGAPVS
ncbi:MAG: zinc ribbon domain-containing protein [Verrucomicrobia bacterium]|nr:zinc ribbon domain-containing protein [Verrucomicrobiota bacterium]